MIEADMDNEFLTSLRRLSDEEIVARLAPRPEVAAKVRKLPTPRAECTTRLEASFVAPSVSVAARQAVRDRRRADCVQHRASLQAPQSVRGDGVLCHAGLVLERVAVFAASLGAVPGLIRSVAGPRRDKRGTSIASGRRARAVLLMADCLRRPR